MTFMYQPHISHALITSGLDYCNKVLHSLAAYQVKKIHRVQNSAARLIYRLSKYCHVTSFCKNAHLLPVYSRTQFKILVITYVEFEEPHGLVCSSRTAKHSYSTRPYIWTLPWTSMTLLLALILHSYFTDYCNMHLNFVWNLCNTNTNYCNYYYYHLIIRFWINAFHTLKAGQRVGWRGRGWVGFLSFELSGQESSKKLYTEIRLGLLISNYKAVLAFFSGVPRGQILCRQGHYLSRNSSLLWREVKEELSGKGTVNEAECNQDFKPCAWQ